ncbi:YqjF family protein [Cytobacillus sp. Hz8]|uniref:YqjF family protein n=1 Tax=Cytobacillus sp. Hz8 TaxID=3347168 RepID=UPI0035DCE163
MEGNVKINKWDAGHRLWPLPNFPWVMKQTWNDLLFAHFPVKIEKLRNFIPDVLPIDTYQGVAWIGIVSFQMGEISLRWLPPLPGAKKFPQLNVRTYITMDGKPGVYFFSLDAANKLVARVVKTLLPLPYWHACMKTEYLGESIHFESKREVDKTFEWNCNYRPSSKVYLAKKGSFDEWMAERYCFYAVNKKGTALRCDILHHRWPLQHAEVEIHQNTMLLSHGIQVEAAEPLFHFSKGMEVRIWPLFTALN